MRFMQTLLSDRILPHTFALHQKYLTDLEHSTHQVAEPFLDNVAISHPFPPRAPPQSHLKPRFMHVFRCASLLAPYLPTVYEAVIAPDPWNASARTLDRTSTYLPSVTVPTKRYSIEVRRSGRDSA